MPVPFAPKSVLGNSSGIVGEWAESDDSGQRRALFPNVLTSN